MQEARYGGIGRAGLSAADAAVSGAASTANVVDRYAHGFMREDDAVDDLATTMADFITTTRQRARDAREATHG